MDALTKAAGCPLLSVSPLRNSTAKIVALKDIARRRWAVLIRTDCCAAAPLYYPGYSDGEEDGDDGNDSDNNRNIYDLLIRLPL